MLNQLSEQFPIASRERSFEFFPFSNEIGHPRILNKLNSKAINEKSSNRELNAALLFGESHFLSMLPELRKHVRYVLLADIEPRLFLHTMHLLQCITKASNIKDFLVRYSYNNPIEGEKLENPAIGFSNILNAPHLTEILTNKDWGMPYYLGEYYFLSSEERYVVCKEAASQLLFSFIQFDLTDVTQCQRLSNTLYDNSINLKLCNFSNIHEYDENMDKIRISVPVLLSKATDYQIMYTTNMHNANISSKLKYYFELVRKREMDKDNDLLSIVTSEKTDEIKERDDEMDDVLDSFEVPIYDHLMPIHSVPSPEPVTSTYHAYKQTHHSMYKKSHTTDSNEECPSGKPA